jgi:hypothetical protein
MNENNFWWSLLCIVQDHNRWVISGGDADSIVQCHPCVSTQAHDTTNVWHWVITLDFPAPISLLATYLSSVPRYLAQAFSVEGNLTDVNPFEVCRRSGRFGVSSDLRQAAGLGLPDKPALKKRPRNPRPATHESTPTKVCFNSLWA